MKLTPINPAATFVSFLDAKPAHPPIITPNETGPTYLLNRDGVTAVFALFEPLIAQFAMDELLEALLSGDPVVAFVFVAVLIPEPAANNLYRLEICN